jgi:hypothetical protein
MGLVFDFVQRYPAARCHLGADKDHQNCHPYGRQYHPPLALRIDVSDKKAACNMN